MTLTGVKDSPLPFESTGGALLRLAWDNVFTFRELIRIVRRSGSLPQDPTLTSPGWIDSAVAFAKTGWSLPCAGERFIAWEMRDHLEIWFDDGFRFCPICMEAAYHTYWFQLRQMTICPIHGCLIESNCQSCGARAPRFALHPDLFGSPYDCRHCGQPFCGASITAEARQEFRDHAVQLQHEFADLDFWLFQIRREKLKDECSRGPYSEWYDASSIRLMRAQQLFPLPQRYRPRSRYRCSVLSWKIRLRPMPSDMLLFSSRRSINLDSAEAVLRCVMRKLERWIFNNRDLSEMMVAAKRELKFPLNPQEWEPKVLAYFVFRDVFSEGKWPDKSSTLANTRLTCFWAVTRHFPSWDNRIIKPVFKYYLISIFVGCFFLASKERAAGVTASSTFRIFRLPELEAYTQRDVRRSCHLGWIVFPAMDGFPFRGKVIVDDALSL